MLFISQAVSDTLVMSNLGYFQLKSRPGTWVIQPPPGRSREIYQIKEGKEDGGSEVAVASFEPKPVVLSVSKRPV